MSENKYSLICFTFTDTLNQLHFILVFIFHIISFFSFSHLIFNGVHLLTYLPAANGSNLKYRLPKTKGGPRPKWPRYSSKGGGGMA